MISSLLKKVFSPDPTLETAHLVYVSLVEQSRKEFFYKDFGVSDNIDGRFDVIVLHLFIITDRMKKDCPELLRSIWEVFFSDMDRSLREMGASDTGIGKRIKKMVQAFYGRIDSYDKTFSNEGDFIESLKRNLYRGQDVTEGQLRKIADYVKQNIASIKSQDIEKLRHGEIYFINN